MRFRALRSRLPGLKLQASRLALCGCVACLSAGACDEPDAAVIARYPDDASIGASGADGSAGNAADSGASGASETSGAGASGSSGDSPVVPVPRGRVRVVGGKLESDIGTPLRGLLLPVDTDWTPTAFGQIADIAARSGLNTLHVYLENSSTATIGDNYLVADNLVLQAERNGLYVVLGFGTGAAVGKVDPLKLKAFWSFYAPRYAAFPHVIYEIQNNPELTCDVPVTSGTFNVERDMYRLIRASAPDTHVLLFSTHALIEPSVFNDAVMRMTNIVDWSNASFALGITGSCLELSEFSRLTAAAAVLKVPLVINQLPSDGWGPYITRFEADAISWFHYRWFAEPSSHDLASYQRATIAAGVSWCPERGVFPRDARSCH